MEAAGHEEEEGVKVEVQSISSRRRRGARLPAAATAATAPDSATAQRQVGPDQTAAGDTGLLQADAPVSGAAVGTVPTADDGIAQRTQSQLPLHAGGVSTELALAQQQAAPVAGLPGLAQQRVARRSHTAMQLQSQVEANMKRFDELLAGELSTSAIAISRAAQEVQEAAQQVAASESHMAECISSLQVTVALAKRLPTLANLPGSAAAAAAAGPAAPAS